MKIINIATNSKDFPQLLVLDEGSTSELEAKLPSVAKALKMVYDSIGGVNWSDSQPFYVVEKDGSKKVYGPSLVKGESAPVLKFGEESFPINPKSGAYHASLDTYGKNPWYFLKLLFEPAEDVEVDVFFSILTEGKLEDEHTRLFTKKPSEFNQLLREAGKGGGMFLYEKQLPIGVEFRITGYEKRTSEAGYSFFVCRVETDHPFTAVEKDGSGEFEVEPGSFSVSVKDSLFDAQPIITPEEPAFLMVREKKVTQRGVSVKHSLRVPGGFAATDDELMW